MPSAQEKDVEVLIRARYPLIYVVSWEERRVDDMVLRIAQKQGKRAMFWTVTQGVADERGGVLEKSARDPQAALDYVSKSEAAALFVLKDFHSYMQDAGVVRRLRDLVLGLKSSYKTLILLSPVLTIPVELEKDVTVVDYDLPSAEDIQALLKEIIGASKSGKFAVELKPEEEDKLVSCALGMTLSEAENAFAKAITINSKLSIEDVDVILQETKQIIRKSRMLEYFEAQEDLKHVGGLEVLKDWLVKRGRAFSAKARQFGLPQPRGVLLLGVQGCGKSLTCKAISSIWKLPLLRLDMGSIFGGIVGQSEENMRRAIKTAESVAPCVLWLDEIEKGLAGTQSSNFSDAGTTARVFSTFLTWLQEKTKAVFVAATANNIQMLPPELLRKGRLDEIFFVDLPNHRERMHIFAIHVAKKGRDYTKLNLDALAALAEGFSGAEIEQAVVSALYDAFYQGREMAQADLENALRITVPLSRTMREEIDGLRQWAQTRARPASPPAEAGAPAQAAQAPAAAGPAQPGFSRRLELPPQGK